MTGAGKVFFYVQHLLGIGHLVRARRIVRALTADGFDVLLVMGGEPTPGLEREVGARTLQLPPVRAGVHNLSSLAHLDDAPFGPEDRANRAALLLDAFRREAPDVLLMEAFPFGRRAMRFELLPLLEAAHARRPRPLIVSSIRDILQAAAKPGRAEEIVALVRDRFDLVLAHGDRVTTPLEASFPLAPLIADKLVYTGLVGPERGPDVPERHDVIVSAGGGAVGEGLLRAALTAASNPRFAGLSWLALAGPNMPEAVVSALAPPAQISLRRFAADLPARLRGCRVAVAQAGYNTVADILAAGCAAVLAPFAAGGETEQTQRAAALAAAGRAHVIDENALTADALADALAAALAEPRWPSAALTGAAKTARALRSRLARVST